LTELTDLSWILGRALAVEKASGGWNGMSDKGKERRRRRRNLEWFDHYNIWDRSTAMHQGISR